ESCTPAITARRFSRGSGSPAGMSRPSTVRPATSNGTKPIPPIRSRRQSGADDRCSFIFGRSQVGNDEQHQPGSIQRGEPNPSEGGSLKRVEDRNCKGEARFLYHRRNHGGPKTNRIGADHEEHELPR